MEVTGVPLGTAEWRRNYAKSAHIPLRNRFFEEDPVPLDGQAALLARPGLKRWLSIGTGPFRGIYSQQGVFGDALFVVSGTGLYRIDVDETVTLVGNGLAGNPDGYVSMVATDVHLFVADGANLFAYTDNSYSDGTLTASGTISNGDKVTLGTSVYQFTNTDVDTGSPQGTAGNPWLVAMGGSTATALENLALAIDAGGSAGSTYSTALEPNIEATVVDYTATTIRIRARNAGSDGDTIATTETSAGLSWGAVTLGGGGETDFFSVPMPDNVGALWVDVLASFVLVVTAQVDEKKGRFYWIEPGETEVDPLNFATAERAPDELFAMITLGDRAWLFGSGTLETWYATGDGDAPFQRVQGVAYDHGAWEGTAIKIKDIIIVAGRDGSVWRIGPEGLRKISNHSVEQRIREAIKEQLT